MKNLYVTFITFSLLASVGCNQKERSNSIEIKESKEAVKQVNVNKTTISEPIDSIENKPVIRYATAQSGLNYREEPDGKVLGKFFLNEAIEVVEYTNKYYEIVDDDQIYEGTWLGIKKQKDTVYVVDAFVSDSPVYSDRKVYYVTSIDPYGEDENYKDNVNISEAPNYNSNFYSALDEEKTYSKEYFEWDKAYRDNFLKAGGITKYDQLHVTKITIGQVASYPIKDLKLIANVNVYASGSGEYNVYDFETCLELPENTNTDFDFATIAIDNPFETATDFKYLKWYPQEEIESLRHLYTKRFPYLKSEFSNEPKTKLFYTSYNNYTIYSLDHVNKYNLLTRYVIVIKENGEITNSFIEQEGESTGLIPLNTDYLESSSQFAMKLFKNEPPLIYGLSSESFGCPKLYYLESNYPNIILSCDNRH